MCAMSVLENAKSNRHRKAHEVESDGPARKFAHLTRGGLGVERQPEVSRGHSSEEAGRKIGRAKGRRTRSGGQPPNCGGQGKELAETIRDQQLRQVPGLVERSARWIREEPKSGASESAAVRREVCKDDT